MNGPQDRWDLVVLGGGTAGLVASQTAAALGARTLLVEPAHPGGDCLWTGCVPSKTLISLAARHRTTNAGPTDLAAVMGQVRAAIEQIAPIDSVETIESKGVTVLAGTGRLVGPRLLQVGNDEVRFSRLVLATGAAPVIPPVPGLAEIGVLTSETVWDLTKLPTSLLVLGGGAIGCELAQAFARLGAQVRIVDAADRLLSTEHPADAAALTQALESEGIDIVLGAKVLSARIAPEGHRELDLADGSVLSAEAVLVAAGRRPRTAGIGLEVAGVEVGAQGNVVVDDRLRTTSSRIWAAGDVTGRPGFTHVAAADGSTAAANAVLGVRRRVDPWVPRVTYTDPELAAFGDLADPRVARIQVQDHADLDRAITEGRTEGSTRLGFDSAGRIVAASVLGPRAGETMQLALLAARSQMRSRDLAGLMQAYPTWTDALGRLAVRDARADLERRPVQALIRLLRTLRR